MLSAVMIISVLWATPDATLVKEVLRYANSGRLFEEIAAGYTNSFLQGLAKVDPVIRDNIKNVTAESFDLLKVTPSLEREFSKSMDDDSLREVKRWYEGALGKRVREIESSERFGEGSKKRREFILDIVKTPTPETRMRLIEMLEERTQVAKGTLDAVTALTVTMAGNMMTASQQSEDDRKAFLSQLESAIRQSSGPQVSNDTIINHQFVYRSLSDEELEAYIQFLGSPAGQKYSRAVWSSLKSTLEEAGTEAGRRCAEVLRKFGVRRL